MMQQKEITDLENGIFEVLKTYSNVHRGKGYNSQRTTELYEQARDILIRLSGLKKSHYSVIFCSPYIASVITGPLQPGSYKVYSSETTGLSIGIRALVIQKKALAKMVPKITGGGTTRLIARDWIEWSRLPEKLEAGTPAVINALLLVRALQLQQQPENGNFSSFGTSGPSREQTLFHDEFAGITGHELLQKLRESVIGRDLQIPSGNSHCRYINFDHASSTRTFRPVWEVFRDCWFTKDDQAAEVISYAKKVIAGFFDAPEQDYDIIFTSNTTEALNIAASSLRTDLPEGTQPVVLNTVMEHNSNELPWRFVPGIRMERLDVDQDGFIDLQELESVLIRYNKRSESGNQRIRLVSICGASNVLGSCNDLEAIGRIVHQYGAELLVDGAQLAAHKPVSLKNAGMDYFAFSGHKLYAPFGSSAFIARKGLLKFNAEEMSSIRKSGEENLAGIAALGKALQLLERVGMETVAQDESALTAALLSKMSQVPGIVVYGIADAAHPRFDQKAGVVSFNFKKIIAHTVAKRLALLGGIGTRSGCHCAHIMVKRMLGVKPPFEGVQRMIVKLAPSLQLPGVARISIGIENDMADIDRLAEVLHQVAAGRKS